MPTKRDLLIEAAARILTEEGRAAVTARRVAKETGTSTMAVYTHFGSMDDLLAAVLALGFARFHRKLAAVGTSDDALRDLDRLGVAYRRFAKAEPDLYRAMFGGELRFESLTPEQAAQAASTFELLREAVARAADAHRVAVDPEAGARQLWAAVHGFVMLELAGLLEERRPARAYGALLATLGRGLASAPAAPARLRP